MTPPESDDTAVASNRQAQRDLYGDTLDARISRITERYGVSQRRLAQVLGISAPMLSQLISARRVKMGNTLAYERMVTLEDRAAEVADPDSAARVLDQVAASDIVTTTRMRTRSHPDRDGSDARARALLGAVDAAELQAARTLLSSSDTAPHLVELIDEALREDG